MEEISIKIPDDLIKELQSFSNIDKSLLVSRLLKEKLEEISRLKKIVSKSQLTEKKAQEISDEINESLARRYDSL